MEIEKMKMEALRKKEYMEVRQERQEAFSNSREFVLWPIQNGDNQGLCITYLGALGQPSREDAGGDV